MVELVRITERMLVKHGMEHTGGRRARLSLGEMQQVLGLPSADTRQKTEERERRRYIENDMCG